MRAGAARIFAASAIVALSTGLAARAGAGTLAFDPLAQPAVGAFTPIRLTGYAQMSAVAFTPFGVDDETASGAGWHLTLQMTAPLTNGTTTVGATAYSMDAPTITGVGGSDPATWSNTGPAKEVPADAGASTAYIALGDDVSSLQTIVSAPAEPATGGYYLIALAPLKVLIPAHATQGTYTSAIEISLASGP
jgi:hypothetical protein